MSTIKSQTEHLTLNADGTGKEVKIQRNGTQKLATTSTGIDVTGSVTCDGLTSYTTTANSQLYLTSQDTGQSAVNFGGTTSNAKGSIRYSDNSDWMKIYTNSSERMLIDGSGNVGIGTTSNIVNGGSSVTGQWFNNEGYVAIARNSSSSGLYINKTNGDTTNNSMIAFKLNGSIVGGDVDIDNGAARYNTTSDYRLKENVEPLSGSIDRLKQLNPCSYNFIEYPDIIHDGFIAHEVQEVVAGAVSGTKDAMKDEEYEVEPAVEAITDEEGNVTTEAVEAVMGEREVEDYQGIDQSKLVPLLVSSLQEAVAKIEVLEAEVKAIKDKYPKE